MAGTAKKWLHAARFWRRTGTNGLLMAEMSSSPLRGSRVGRSGANQTRNSGACQAQTAQTGEHRRDELCMNYARPPRFRPLTRVSGSSALVTFSGLGFSGSLWPVLVFSRRQARSESVLSGLSGPLLRSLQPLLVRSTLHTVAFALDDGRSDGEAE
ncbi:hypothetical protein GGR52DRAFT_536079 [Hypoxylon sp. FL1284]|nr:hypothetical protein GGR52DRAFT_536079 [Hypoxylon sp. FL1284]